MNFIMDIINSILFSLQKIFKRYDLTIIFQTHKFFDYEVYKFFDCTFLRCIYHIIVELP